MLTETSDAITKHLRSIAGIQHVGEWSGDVEELLRVVHPIPSLHLVYTGAKFGDAPAAIGTKIAPHAMVWTVVLLSKNLRSHAAGALEAYAHIEAVREQLIKFQVPAGWLWPTREGLIAAKGGLLAYGLDYTIKARA